MSLVRWDLISKEGPALSFAAGCVVNNALYVHGGLTARGSTEPSGRLYSMDLSSRVWTVLTTPGSPTLSHHVATGSHDGRYLLLIGGWDGRVRLSDIHCYDIAATRWCDVKTTGFAVGAGLSSHTVTWLSENTALVIGREGSLRTQRRSGNAFELRADFTKFHFTYKNYPVSVASRSGHTTDLVMESRLAVIGGRADKLVDQHTGFTGCRQASQNLNTKLARVVSSAPAMTKDPCGRKHHVSAGYGDLLFLHGGETFDGRNRDPVGDMYVCKFPHLMWYNMGVSDVCRAGHVSGVKSDVVYIHGGVGVRGKIHWETYRLNMDT